MYQVKEGQLAYILHRVSGVAIIGFLFIHIVENFLLLLGPDAYNAGIELYHNYVFRLGEFALILAVVYHAFNGLRIIIIDFWNQSTKYHKVLWYGAMALTVLVAALIAKPLLLDYQDWPWMTGEWNPFAGGH